MRLQLDGASDVEDDKGCKNFSLRRAQAVQPTAVLSCTNSWGSEPHLNVGKPVGREDRIEATLYGAISNDQREPLDELSDLWHYKCGQPQRPGKLQLAVAEKGIWQVQALLHLSLVVDLLC